MKTYKVHLLGYPCSFSKSRSCSIIRKFNNETTLSKTINKQNVCSICNWLSINWYSRKSADFPHSHPLIEFPDRPFAGTSQTASRCTTARRVNIRPAPERIQTIPGARVIYSLNLLQLSTKEYTVSELPSGLRQDNTGFPFHTHRQVSGKWSTFSPRSLLKKWLISLAWWPRSCDKESLNFAPSHSEKVASAASGENAIIRIERMKMARRLED